MNKHGRGLLVDGTFQIFGTRSSDFREKELSPLLGLVILNLKSFTSIDIRKRAPPPGGLMFKPIKKSSTILVEGVPNTICTKLF